MCSGCTFLLHYYVTFLRIPNCPYNSQKMRLEIVHDRVTTGATRVVWTAFVQGCGKEMGKQPHYRLYGTVYFQEQRQMRDASSGDKTIRRSITTPLGCSARAGGLFKEQIPHSATSSTWWRSWLRHCATSRKVAGSIPDGIIGVFHWHNPSGCTRALRSSQRLTEMSTGNISWGWVE